MDLSAYLAQVLGIYMIIVGLALIIRWRAIIPVVDELVRNRPLLYTIAMLELLAGLAIVIAHNIWIWNYAVLITILGWWMIIESLFYLFIPHRIVYRLIYGANNKALYIAGGIIAMALGVFLTQASFA